MGEPLCECENLGWEGVERCPVHPECESSKGCGDYPDAYRGPHPARVTQEQREAAYRKVGEHLERAAQQQDWFRGAQVVGIAVELPYHVKTEGHTADCECPKCEPRRWG